jgi:hypothetical protein
MTIDESFDHDNICPVKISDAVAMSKDEIQQDIDKAKKREMLVHLNVEVEGFDTRTADQIADFLLSALHVGLEGHEEWEGIGTIVCPLAEEV